MDLLLNSEPFRTRLAETINWCSERVAIHITEHQVYTELSRWNREVEVTYWENMESNLRSPELRPPNIFIYESYPKGWDEPTVRKAVDALCAKRAGLLQEQGRYSDYLAPDLAGGRLLVAMPNHTLNDGPSESETDGYLDVSDVPPWDTWIHYEEGRLISWVHPLLIPLVNDGIHVNASGCIFWLEE